jgi:UPF0716 protein FxsA
MAIALVLIFIVVPILELALIIQVGEAIGVWWTIALLLADAFLGAWLWRHQGRAAWRRFNLALSEGRPPTKEVMDGVLIIFGGALLITPGFISDFFGILLLAPPTRAGIRRLIVSRFLPRTMRAGFTAAAAGAGARAGRRRGGAGFGEPRGWDVEGSATEIPPDPPQLPS